MLHILIPTRNRPDLLRFALETACRESEATPSAAVRIWVSDNSGAAESEKVRATADEFPQATYLRPPEELSMTNHWEWAIGQVLASGQDGYLGILTDRFGVQPGGLLRLHTMLTKEKADLLSFQYDTIDDFTAETIRVTRSKSSGKVTWIPQEAVFENCQNCRFGVELPRLLNCVVRIEKLEEIRQNTGRYVSSVSPDFSFCFEYLSANAGIHFYDSAVFFQHGLNRSNGLSFTRDSNKSKEAMDFAAFRQNDTTWKAPVGHVDCLLNAIVHEWSVVSDRMVSTGSDPLPPISIQKYGDTLLDELKHRQAFDQPALRSQLADLGWASESGVGSPVPFRQKLVLWLVGRRWGFRLLSLLSPLPVINQKRAVFSTKPQALAWLWQQAAEEAMP